MSSVTAGTVVNVQCVKGCEICWHYINTYNKKIKCKCLLEYHSLVFDWTLLAVRSKVPKLVLNEWIAK